MKLSSTLPERETERDSYQIVIDRERKREHSYIAKRIPAKLREAWRVQERRKNY